MEINLKKLGEQAVESSTGTKKMRLSENATAMVFQLFTKNIYSNPIGTVVREITSNCFDSHVEAKINAPVLIKKSVDNQTGTHYISFIDYGVGMSPNRIENIYGVYFESTKRCDNTQIGGYGIGGKTPLAYKRSTGHGEGEYDNSFYVITNFEGIKYFYCIFEGEDSPAISLLHSEATTEGNGTEVRIPILEKDLYSFSNEMIRQLYYFENIVFENFDDDRLSNEYQIIRGKTFLFRGSEYNGYIHVCLGRVAYPIDYSVLGLSSNDYRLPIAIKLEVGEIGVVASREHLDYSEATIKVLKKKLGEVVSEIKELLTKQYDNIVTLQDYFIVKNEFGKLVFPNGMSINVGNLIPQKDVDFSNYKYSFLKMPNDKQLFRLFFDTKTYGNKNKSKYVSGSFENGYDTLKRCTNLFYVENEFVRKVAKQSYLKDTHDTYIIINKRNICDNSNRHEISDLFNVHIDSTVDANGKPSEYIQSLLDMQEEYMSIVRDNASNYDTIEVPAEFLVRKKYNVLNNELRNTTIPIKLFGSNSKVRIKLNVLFNFNNQIFYGTQEDETNLNNSYEMFRTLFGKHLIVNRYDTYKNTLTMNDKNKGVMFIMVSSVNVKYLQHCKNAIHISKFYDKMLYRKASIVENYFQTYDFIEKYENLNRIYKHSQFIKINAKTGKLINTVNKFVLNLIENNNNDICLLKIQLSKYFNTDNITMTAEQIKIDKMIGEIQSVEEQNQHILEYINLPYSISDINNTLCDILKKIMVF